MKRWLRLGLLWLLVCATAVTDEVAAQMPDQSTSSSHQVSSSSHSAPRHVKLEFENDNVRVLRIRIAPHEKTPMHEAPPRVVVYLTDDHSILYFPDGTTQQEKHAAGDVAWFGIQRHAGENRADKPIEFITIIPKTQATKNR